MLEKNKDGQLAIHKAAQMNNSAFLEMFANMTMYDFYNRKSDDSNVRGQFPYSDEALDEDNFAEYMKDEQGNTPFHLASENGDIQAMMVLFSKGVAGFEMNRQGKQPSDLYRVNGTTRKRLVLEGLENFESLVNAKNCFYRLTNFEKEIVDISVEILRENGLTFVRNNSVLESLLKLKLCQKIPFSAQDPDSLAKYREKVEDSVRTQGRFYKFAKDVYQETYNAIYPEEKSSSSANM